MRTNRGDFIKFVIAGAVATGCPHNQILLAPEANQTPGVEGEDKNLCHQLRDGRIFSRPPAMKCHDIGGGVGGLAAAFLLSNRDCLILEKEPHWGGNVYLMKYEGMAFATGTAFTDAEVADWLAKEIGLEKMSVNNCDCSILPGEFISDTWGEGLNHPPYSECVRDSSKKFRKERLAVDGERRAIELDNVPFSDFMKGHAAETRTHFLTATAAARHMAKKKSGVVLMMTAPPGRVRRPLIGAFGAACAAIEAFPRTLSAEVGPRGIRVVCLRSSGSPGRTDTGRNFEHHAKVAGLTVEQFQTKLSEATMLRRLTTLSEVANVAAIVASDQGSALTGTAVNCRAG